MEKWLASKIFLFTLFWGPFSFCIGFNFVVVVCNRSVFFCVGRVVGVLERNWRDYIATVPAQVHMLHFFLRTQWTLYITKNNYLYCIFQMYFRMKMHWSVLPAKEFSFTLLTGDKTFLLVLLLFFICLWSFRRRIPKIRILTSQQKQLQGNRILVRIGMRQSELL